MKYFHMGHRMDEIVRRERDLVMSGLQGVEGDRPRNR
jgi:hypothetical protein